MMAETWNKFSTLPVGGLITGMSAIGENLWVCSPGGLFVREQGNFIRRDPSQWPIGVSAVLAADRFVLAALGSTARIVRSVNNGLSWSDCRMDPGVAPVTSFAAMPGASPAVTILAGTDGDGILRSTDGGGSWQLSNFGLRSFHVLGLAWAPISSDLTSAGISYHYEMVYAACEQGVFRSPNGGRAWQPASQGLPDLPILSIAISNNFRKKPVKPGELDQRFDGAVFAGTDGAGLFRSLDGGESWVWLDSWPGADGEVVNCLYFDKEGNLYAGSGEHGILVSTDLGESWQPLPSIEDAVLSLACCGAQVFSGTASRGLLVFEEGGNGWSTAGLISTRLLEQLLVTQEGSILANGQVEGVWHHAGGEWMQLEALDPPDGEALHVLAISADKLLGLTSHQLLMAALDDSGWRVIRQAAQSFTALGCSQDGIWLGCQNGECLVSNDGGMNWQVIPAPTSSKDLTHFRAGKHAPVVGLLPNGRESFHAVTRTEKDGLLSLWRWDASGWTVLFQERAGRGIVRLLPGSDQTPILVSSGADLFALSGNTWKQVQSARFAGQITDLLLLPELNVVLSAGRDGIRLSRDFCVTWETSGLSGEPIAALCKAPGTTGRVMALTVDGRLYAHDF